MSQRTPVDPQSLRRRARLLIRDLRGRDDARAVAAAAKLRGLRSFRDCSAEQLRRQSERVRLKHALAVMAEENGFPSWPALLRSVETHFETDYTASLDAMLCA